MDINTELEVKKTQKILLNILDEILRVCETENLNVFLGGGSLLGSLRHKGFIPWDDDIDLFMPREDYEKLSKIWKNCADEKYVLIRTTKDKNYHFRVIGIADSQTTVVKKYNIGSDLVHALFVDIMPIDGIPNSKLLRGIQIVDACLFNVFNVQRKANFENKLISLVTDMALRLIKNTNIRYMIWSHSERRISKYSLYDTAYCKELTTKTRAMFRPLPSDWFINYDYGEFEGRKVKIPSGAEKWMTQIYGDFMTLPPDDEQVPIHDSTVVFKDLDTPYVEYRGIYFK